MSHPTSKLLSFVLACAALLIGGGAVASTVGEGYSVQAQGIPHDRLFSIAFAGDYGVAVGDVGQIMVSEDGGASWVRSKAPTDLALLSVAVNGGRTIAVGQMGLILIRDRGEKWKEVESGTKERLLKVAVNSNGLAFAVGAFGTVLRSKDNGLSWELVSPEWKNVAQHYLHGSEGRGSAILNPSLYGIHVGDDGSVIIAGEIGYIVHSNDAGKNWGLVRLGEHSAQTIAPTIFDLEVQKDGFGVAVGQSGLILKTTDGGKNWNQIDVPVNANLFSVAMFDGDSIAVVGMRTVLRSKDAGASWEHVTKLDLDTRWYVDLTPASANPSRGLLAVGHSGRIIKFPSTE